MSEEESLDDVPDGTELEDAGHGEPGPEAVIEDTEHPEVDYAPPPPDPHPSPRPNTKRKSKAERERERERERRRTSFEARFLATTTQLTLLITKIARFASSPN